MQIKVNKLQKTVDGDVQGANAVVIFLDKGNIVHEERFTGKTTGQNDHPFKRKVIWDGMYDKHEAVILDIGTEFEYELVPDEDKELSALASLLNKSSEDYAEGKVVSTEELKSNLKDRTTKKNADKQVHQRHP